jgi:hypothetical protein
MLLLLLRSCSLALVRSALAVAVAASPLRLPLFAFASVFDFWALLL